MCGVPYTSKQVVCNNTMVVELKEFEPYYSRGTKAPLLGAMAK
jgi:hypothetical protein